MVRHPLNAASEPHSELIDLTSREVEVLSWVSEGKTNHEIGLILGAGTRTICKHVEHILSKLRVENRTAAAAMALREPISKELEMRLKQILGCDSFLHHLETVVPGDM